MPPSTNELRRTVAELRSELRPLTDRRDAIQAPHEQALRCAVERLTAMRKLPIPHYKVLGPDGCSLLTPVGPYPWNLPVADDDGGWIPGAWHEVDERPIAIGEHGLHTTVTPDIIVRFYDHHSHRVRVFEAEVEGDSCLNTVGWLRAWDPLGGLSQVCQHESAARRVRLLRPVSLDEAMAASAMARSFLVEQLGFPVQGDPVPAGLAAEIDYRMARICEIEAEIEGREARASRLVRARAEAALSRRSDAETGSPFLVFCTQSAQSLVSIRSASGRKGAAQDIFATAVRFLRIGPDELSKAAQVLGVTPSASDYLTAIAFNPSYCVAHERTEGFRPWWIESRSVRTPHLRFTRKARQRVGRLSEFWLPPDCPLFDDKAIDESGGAADGYMVRVTSLSNTTLRATAAAVRHDDGAYRRPTSRVHVFSRGAWESFWEPRIEELRRRRAAGW